MLKDRETRPLSERDRMIFDALVPRDHYLRRALAVIDFERLRDCVAGCYHPDQGRPAEDPVLMFKLYFLQYHDNLSDEKVFVRAQTDVSYRFFLGLSLEDTLPHPSTLCYFRGRVGVEGHKQCFNDVIGQAREHGLVRDRVRIKDATHMIANVAIPTTLRLVAQARDRLLAAAEPFDPLRVEGERAQIETIRVSAKGRSLSEQLIARITHVREILAWVDELTPPPDQQTDRCWQKLVEIRHVAHKILADQDHPNGGDRIRSVVDSDSRCGKHGDFYDGYLLDIIIDPHSELITQIDILPANGDEAANAVFLVQAEQEAHGNDIEQLSIDGIGFNGSVLRELSDPEGLGLDVYVPPKPIPSTGRFTPDDFHENPEENTVTCPAGETSQYRQRDSQNRATIYRFSRETCMGCSHLAQCMEKKPAHFGRNVRKNDYETEYRQAREKAKTAEYTQIRKEHPKVERKLADLTRYHGARRARSRGQPRVQKQALITALVTNVKRIVRLLCAQQVIPEHG